MGLGLVEGAGKSSPDSMQSMPGDPAGGNRRLKTLGYKRNHLFVGHNFPLIVLHQAQMNAPIPGRKLFTLPFPDCRPSCTSSSGNIQYASFQTAFNWYWLLERYDMDKLEVLMSMCIDGYQEYGIFLATAMGILKSACQHHSSSFG